jgi:thioredoxin reductase (NADPH)
VAEEIFDVMIVGGGPAGLVAAMYASRMGMRTLLFERGLLGGRAVEAPIVENFPGFPEGVTGNELVERIIKQVEKFGAELRYPEEVLDLRLDGKVKVVATRSGRFHAFSVIIATGTQKKKLSVPGEVEFLGRGVSYCTICDAPLFRGKVMAVIGSGDEALEDALYLSSLSRKVYLVTEGEEIKAAKSLLERCARKGNIEVLKAKVHSITGDSLVRSIAVSDFESEGRREVFVDGVFISVGEVPMTALVRKSGIAVDERGCIRVDRRQATNIEGVFAAGDCTCGGMQIVTAVGEGAMAAMQSYRYVRKLK